MADIECGIEESIQDSPLGGHETRVLHVDDDPAFGDLVETYLERLGDEISVLRETDPQSGFERLSTDVVDCLISDYQMPHMDGIEFLKTVREEYPNLPFILFTGRGSEEVASEAINAGVTTYLQKSGSETFELLTKQVQNAVSQQRSERLAQVTKDRLFGLYEHADGFYMLDTDWRITYWNQRIANRTDRAPDEVLGRSYWEVFPKARELETHEVFREAMATREPRHFEVQYTPAEYWAEVRVYPVDEGLFVHSRDVTAEKERELEIEQRNRILESFANTVSHDIRNPLTVAEGKLELAQETGDFEHLDEVAQAHNRMRNLIDELLRVGRGEALEFTVVSLEAITEDAWGTVSSEEMELRTLDDGTFEANDPQLRQLFENLFWNALEHGAADTVRVGITEDDGIYVEDDGCGIPPTERDRVFDSGYSTTEEGPGYGLHIVERVVDLHDWEIRVTESTDGGARFEISGVEFVDT